MYSFPSPPLTLEEMKVQDEKVKALITKLMGTGPFSLTAGTIVTIGRKG